MKATLTLSAAGHVALIALLLLLPATMSAPPKVDLSHAVEVVFAAPPAPPPPAPEPPKPVVEPPPPPPPVVEQPPPLPPPPPVAVEPPPPAPPAAVAETPPPPPAPPAAVAETPPPPPPPKREPKPAPKPRPRPVQPVQPVQQPMPELPLPLPTQAPRSQVASIPPPAPAPVISPDYRTLLSSWLETHKRYPEEARQRGEEGRAVLRFRVDRSGRVIDYSVVSTTGFADLDAAVESMMRGAVLPPFPPSMAVPEIEVSVTIRFGLAR